MYEAFQAAPIEPSNLSKTERRYIDAVSDGLRQGMQKHPGLVIMGQDIAEYGGAFKITKGFVEEFGKGRVRNTPICESAIVGAALGLSINACLPASYPVHTNIIWLNWASLNKNSQIKF